MIELAPKYNEAWTEEMISMITIVNPMTTIKTKEKGEEWRPIPEVAIYGKPDLKIIRKGGKVIIGDAKTGKQHNWHKIQNGNLIIFKVINIEN